MNGKNLFLIPLALLFAFILAPTTGATENDVYAILYTDRTLVFQYGDTPEEGRNVRETYSVNLDGYKDADNIPWSTRRSAIKEIVFADSIQPLSMAHWFYGCLVLESIQGLGKLDTSHVTSMARMFENCSRFTEMDLRGLDTSAVTDMRNMFAGCNRLTSLNVSDWDTSRVETMSYMFRDCSTLATLDVSNFNTSSVTDMTSMFNNCPFLTELDVGAWDTYRVTSTAHMFSGCSRLASLDVSVWDTSKVWTMERMFYGCSSLKTLDVSDWDTSRVRNMSYMFYGCSSLTALDVSGFKISNVNMMHMFSGCSSLKTIYAFERFTGEGVMFSGCTSLVGGAGTKYDSSHTGADYARIDNPPDAPGYFTYFTEKNAERPPVTLTLRDSAGETVSMEDLRNGAEIKPEISVPADADETEWNIVEVFLAVYDSQGMMIDLKSWELDMSQPAKFVQTYAIPQNKNAAYVKMMILSESLMPLAAVQELA